MSGGGGHGGVSCVQQWPSHQHTGSLRLGARVVCCCTLLFAFSINENKKYTNFCTFVMLSQLLALFVPLFFRCVPLALLYTHTHTYMCIYDMLGWLTQIRYTNRADNSLKDCLQFSRIGLFSAVSAQLIHLRRRLK